jgi:5-carboxymethyl-2-hydroxymuconic-semialdehyde dehydrogenase
MQFSDVNHYINGQFVPHHNLETFDNISPSTNQVLNRVAKGDQVMVDQAVAAARTAFDEGPWTRLSVTERLKYIYKIAEGINRRVEEIAKLESVDTGLPISQTRKQVARAADNFIFYADMVKAHMYTGEVFHQDGRYVNYTYRKPVGVAGLITPWNTPFMLETWKVAPALATGNTVVLKPAEWSPLSANILAEIIHEVGLPPGVFNVVHGYGELAGAALVAHPDVQLISFTGETATGAEIMKNGAATLKRFSMELGGKSPIIVFDDADLDQALDACIFGVFSLNGERCTANSRLIIQNKIKDAFVQQLLDRLEHIKVGDPLKDDTEVGPLIHREHLQRVKGYLDIAAKEGARVVQGHVPENLADGNFVPPTVLLDVRNDFTVAQEEIFGPVLAVISFDTEEEAIRLANDVKYGLASYIWTQDIKKGHRVAQAMEAGMTWINSPNVRDLRIPFGGAKHSGIGREGGHYAFEFYTEIQAIHVAVGNASIPKFGKR